MTPSPLHRFGALVALILLAAPGLRAQDPAPVESQVEPLFQSHDLLQLRIEADFESIMDDRDEDSEEFPGQVFLIHADGSEDVFPVQIRTRGRFRLQSNTCRFPPLRINFQKGQVEESIFDGQDKIKLVTHCRDSDRYEQNVVKEYLVYRLYNVLTPYSLQARMARIQYVDTSGDDDPVQRLGFFIEMEESAADRIGGEIMPDPEQMSGVHPARIRTVHASRITLFQYMVGNTDFSLYGHSGSPPHNSIPVVRGAEVVPVPYDFDWTGLVRAPYARPDPSLGIRNVRQRLFRGLCRPDLNYEELYAFFQEKREALMAVVRDEPLLGEDEKEDTLDYLDDFWEVMDSERNRRRRIQESCRPI